MVTDISAADLSSWSGAGPLPRARSISSGSGSTAKMTHIVESAVRVEPWEVIRLRNSGRPAKTGLAV